MKTEELRLKHYMICDGHYVSIGDIYNLIDKIKIHGLEEKRHGLARIIKEKNLDSFYNIILSNLHIAIDEIRKARANQSVLEGEVNNNQKLIEYICKICVLSNIHRPVKYADFLNFINNEKLSTIKGLENAKEDIYKLLILCDIHNNWQYRSFIRMNKNKVIGYNILWIDGSGGAYIEKIKD
jgi:hypothetical protein